MRWNADDIIDVFQNGPSGMDYTGIDNWIQNSPTFWNPSSTLVVGVGPLQGISDTVAASDWATMVTQLAQYFKSQGREQFVWEVGNEPDGMNQSYYDDTFNAIAQALHTFNPGSTKSAVRRPAGSTAGSWVPGAQDCGANADFVDWHAYPVNLTDDDAAMYQKGIDGAK